MEDADLALALALQQEVENESPLTPFTASKLSKNVKSPSLVDEFWELTDPNPDIRALFLQFNERFFWGKLSGIEVKWSPRMTVCAGICCYEGRGGLCSVRLSTPLLKLRPRKDLVETLLHEMIHAYLFVTDNNKDHDGHGPEFHNHMYRINAETGTKISVYHSFHDEVAVYKTHWWKCNGSCQKRPPYFGMVKRSMNRAPSANDTWWAEHQRTCGGIYTKVKEPEGFGKKKKDDKKINKGSKSDSEMHIDKQKTKSPDIRSFWGKGQLIGKKSATVTSGSLGNLETTTITSNGILGIKLNEDIPLKTVSSINSDSSSKINSKILSKNTNIMNGTDTSQIPSISSFQNSNGIQGDRNNKLPIEGVMKGSNSTKPSSSNASNETISTHTKRNNPDVNKDSVVSWPTFTVKGELLGNGHDKLDNENLVSTSGSNLNKSRITHGSNNRELNVMHAKTIWNKDKEQTVSHPTFTGKGNTLGQGQGKLSWLAQLRKDMTNPGKRKEPEDISTVEDLCNKSDRSIVTVKNKIKKAILILSDSDEDFPEPPTKKIRLSNSTKNSNVPSLSNSCDMSLPTIKLQPKNSAKSPSKNTIIHKFSTNMSSDNQNLSGSVPDIPMANCPVCQLCVATSEINNHLDLCLTA